MRSSSKAAAAALSGLAALLAVPTTTSAQQPIQLPGIYVESATLAGKSAPPVSGTGGGDVDVSGGVPLDKIGSAVSVVTGEQLRAQQVRNAIDALRSLPG